MEMASFLAGERWSDHPQCTHPLLAAMAREINDRVGDRARQDLVPMIPSVVGLNADDKRIDAWIAREAALTASRSSRWPTSARWPWGSCGARRCSPSSTD